MFVQGQYQLCVSPLLWFSLSKGIVLPEQLGWKKTMAAMGPAEVLDAGAPKNKAEVLLSGRAYAPKGQPVEQMEVGFSVGENLEKAVTVCGNQDSIFTNEGWQRTRLEPFIDMELSWSNAYGGKEFSDNPAGKGFINPDQLLTSNVTLAMPNLRTHINQFEDIESLYTPTCFGSIDVSAPIRLQRAGTYDQQWLDKYYPGLPPDHDPSIFNIAQDDQWLDGKFNGGEAFKLYGVSATTPVINGNLPALRTRAFIQRTESPKKLEVIETEADTLWFFPEEDIGVLVYRGLLNVNDSDALDVQSLMLACENTADEKRPLSYYEKVYALRSNKETALAHVMNDSQLMPIKSKLELKELALEQKHVEDEHAQKMVKAQASMLARMNKVAHQKGALEIEAPKTKLPEADWPSVPVVSSAAIQRGDVDLTESIAALQSLAQNCKRDGEQKITELKGSLEELGIHLEPPKRALDLDVETRFSKPLEPEIPNHTPEESEKLNQVSLEARRLSPKDTSSSSLLSSKGANKLRQMVISALNQKVSLSGVDLSGADLHHLDFSGLDMHDVLLESTNLVACNFTGANLKGAVFTDAKMDGTCFDHCLFANANFSGVDAKQTSFRKARFGQITAIKAKLLKSDFSGAHFKSSTFMDCVLDDSNLAACKLHNARFMKTSLSKVNLSKTDLYQVIFMDIFAPKANFSSAKIVRSVFTQVRINESTFFQASLDRVQFGGDCDLSKCDFSGAFGKTIGFQGAKLVSTRFKDAGIKEANFMDCNFQSANLDGAAFFRCIFSGAKFQDVSAQRANFTESLLRKSIWHNSDLTESEFFSANAKEAVFDNCCMRNIKNVPSKIELRV